VLESLRQTGGLFYLKDPEAATGSRECGHVPGVAKYVPRNGVLVERRSLATIPQHRVSDYHGYCQQTYNPMHSAYLAQYLKLSFQILKRLRYRVSLGKVTHVVTWPVYPWNLKGEMKASVRMYQSNFGGRSFS
jgi:hypothetical protein